MMIKYRVHEVAKDLNVPKKEVLDVLQKYCEETKKHMTALTEEELDLVFESFTQSHSLPSLDTYFADNQEAETEAEAAKAPAAEKAQAPAAPAQTASASGIQRSRSPSGIRPLLPRRQLRMRSPVRSRPAWRRIPLAAGKELWIPVPPMWNWISIMKNMTAWHLKK